MERFKIGNDLFVLFVAMLVAMFGSSIKYLNEMGKKKFSIVAFFISLLTAMFLALVVGFFCLELGVSMYITFSVTGVAGWIGRSFIDGIAQKVQTSINNKIETVINNSSKK